jgi:hypothetical protein
MNRRQFLISIGMVTASTMVSLPALPELPPVPELPALDSESILAILLTEWERIYGVRPSPSSCDYQFLSVFALQLETMYQQLSEFSF